MSGSWANAAQHWISYPPGGFVGSGAYTMVILASSNVASNARLMDWYNSTTEQNGMLVDTGALYGANSDFSSGYGTGLAPLNTWYIYALSKASGSNTYRCHYWAYNSSGTGTMSHGVATGAGNHANHSAATTARVGYAATVSMAGLIAAAAYWNRVLSDSELDTLKSPNLSTWAALSPDLGIQLENWSGTSGDVVFAGGGASGTVSGTVSSGANPSGFNFSTTAAAYPYELLTPTPRYL